MKKNKELYEKMQKTLTPSTVFTEFSSFMIFNMETGLLYNFKPMIIFLQSLYIYKGLVNGQRMKAHNFSSFFERMEWGVASVFVSKTFV